MIGSENGRFERYGSGTLGVDQYGVVTVSKLIQEPSKSEATVRGVEQQLLQLIPIVVGDDNVEIEDGGPGYDLNQIDQLGGQ